MSLSVPNKVIPVSVKVQTGLEKWPHDDGTNDPWWYGGNSPKDYKWRLELKVTPQKHSSHLTREAFEYSGYDIRVNDWIANNASGLALQVVSVELKTRTSAIVVVEDILRYNTFRDPGASGDGSIGVGQAMVFEVNAEGMPKVDPLVASGVSKDFFINVSSRFQGFNEQFDFKLSQIGNAFEVGDVVAVDPDSNGFTKADGTYKNVIGVVTLIGPKLNEFYIRPVQKVIDDFDSLIGDIGDTLYVNDSVAGGLSLAEGSGKGVYTKLRNNTQTQTRGTEINPVSTAGYSFYLNRELVTVPGTGTLGDIVGAINAKTGLTGVIASDVFVPTEATTSLSFLTYGEPGLYIATVPTATINGTLVTFDIDTVGLVLTGSSIAVEEDMAEAINRDMALAAVTDIVADVPSANLLRITSLGGNAITISNGTLDANSNGFAGPSSGSGIPLSTSASTDHILDLLASDARSIELSNVVGTPIEDFGIFSAENGVKGAAIYVEKAVRTAMVYVVADIAERDGLTAYTGDQAYVEDSGNGEWNQFLWNGVTWVTVATADSARTDADTIKITLDHTDVASVYAIGTVSNNSRITLVTIEVTTPFDGSPSLTVGDSGDNSRLVNDSIHDLSLLNTYVIHSDHVYNGGGDTAINAYFDPGGATQGEVVVALSYQ